MNAHDRLFGELRSLVAKRPSPEAWERLRGLVTKSHRRSPGYHADAVEP